MKPREYQVYNEKATDLLWLVEKIYDSGNVALRGLYTPSHVNGHMYAGKLNIVSDAEFDYDYENVEINPISKSN